MKAHEEFRVGRTLKLVDSDAGRKPLSSGDNAADKKQVEQMASRIADLQNLLYAEHKRKLLVILQGMDTSGKDGTVKGVFGKIDPLGIRTEAYKAPSQEERDHDFLWRVHSRVPGNGELVIFNRSHYEDVVITRVHDWIDDEERARRLGHIRDFERLLVETGTVVLKFFLHISKEEQKKRLEARLADPKKHWKFDMQDIVERKSWDRYQTIYQEAITETNTDHAPWYVIPADSKTHRNLAISSIVLHTMETMQLAYPPEDPALATVKIV